MVKDVQLPRRLPLQLAADGSRILAPGFEIAAKRMKDSHPLGLGCDTPAGEQHHQNEQHSYGTTNTGDVPAGARGELLHYNPQFAHRTILRPLNRPTDIGGTAVWSTLMALFGDHVVSPALRANPSIVEDAISMT